MCRAADGNKKTPVYLAFFSDATTAVLSAQIQRLGVEERLAAPDLRPLHQPMLSRPLHLLGCGYG